MVYLPETPIRAIDAPLGSTGEARGPQTPPPKPKAPPLTYIDDGGPEAFYVIALILCGLALAAGFIVATIQAVRWLGDAVQISAPPQWAVAIVAALSILAVDCLIIHRNPRD